MITYPTVNWWPGCLRPYESHASFALRFCLLNNIPFKTGIAFLDVNRNSREQPGIDILRVADLLHENIPAVETVFAPALQFSHHSYAPPSDAGERRRVRYCRECAKYGYHSHFHEIKWLDKCPLHVCELAEEDSRWNPSSILAGKMEALDFVMRTHCRDWPYCRMSLLSPHDQSLERIAALTDWANRADKTAIAFSSGESWHSGELIEEPTSLSEIMGQLQVLEPLPECVRQLAIKPDRQWTYEVRSFSRNAARELERIRSCGLNFFYVFDFYVNVAPRCGTSPRYIGKLQAVKKRLQARHRICTCLWRYVADGWESAWHWIPVNPDERRQESWLCPVKAALEELDRGWGGAELQSLRQARKEHERLVFLSRKMHEAGLIRYVDGSELAPNGHPFPSWDVYAHFEWSGSSPLTRLLDTAAEWEIEAAASALGEWLDGIAAGASPRIRNDPKRVVRLKQSESGVSLIRWVASPASTANSVQPDPG